MKKYKSLGQALIIGEINNYLSRSKDSRYYVKETNKNEYVVLKKSTTK